jgi:hypothetical protein
MTLASAREAVRRVRTRQELAALRDASDLDEVIVEASGFKHRGLMPCALRYALWAVRPGGRIIVRDQGEMDHEGTPYAAPFNLTRNWAVRFLSRDADLVAFDPAGQMEFVRTAPILAPGWSAGVIFSGREAELESLAICLRGLLAQPELTAERGGQIVVCGPAASEPDLSAFPGVTYLPYDTAPGARFLITRKKNHLASALTGPRLLILHVRVVLEPGALAAVPREFDILSPNTFVEMNGALTPYLSLTAMDPPLPGRPPRRLSVNTRNLARIDPLTLHERGFVYVDGGAFMVPKSLFEACPLDPNLAWEEGEDVEWCLRALVEGYISDLAIGCRAISQTSKYRPRPRLGPLTRPAEKAVRAVRWLKAAGRHRLLSAMGRR